MEPVLGLMASGSAFTKSPFGDDLIIFGLEPVMPKVRPIETSSDVY